MPNHLVADDRFSPEECARFEADGFIVARGLGDAALRERMLDVTRTGVERLIAPIEFEADLNYPGAPRSRDDVGGRTVRRLKQALSRDFVFIEWLQQPAISNRLRQLLGPVVYCPLAHHNCIMTKAPAFSSDTGWHQDTRYWSFTRPDLVNVWLALGHEYPQNGCLKVIPGTHRMTFDRSRLDGELFLRKDLPENQPLLEREAFVELLPGDVLFFHARTFHAASRNHTQETKYSVVFTFRGADNPPLAGSRSAAFPELLLHGENS
ncbi:MAG: phytanoyl-CoA dioxygenase family protein [Planctomycetaceae bacterium]|nr:phytanoyl-CoA dioxygenase family protein [Planctomycetaceae bacterium]